MFFKTGPVAWPRRGEVLGEVLCCSLSIRRVLGEELGCQPRSPEGVITHEGQVSCSRVCDSPMEVEGVTQVLIDEVLLSHHFQDCKLDPGLGLRIHCLEVIKNDVEPLEERWANLEVQYDARGLADQLVPRHRTRHLVVVRVPIL